MYGRNLVPVVISYVPEVPASVSRPDKLPSIAKARLIPEMWLYSWPVRMQGAKWAHFEATGERSMAPDEIVEAEITRLNLEVQDHLANREQRA